MGGETISFRKNFGRLLSPWKHLVIFLGILAVTVIIKHGAAKFDVLAPQLAAWEIAALFHVLLVAQKLMQFRGFEFATKKFNSGVQRFVVNVIILFILLKLIAVIFETQIIQNGKLIVLIDLPDRAVMFENIIHFIAPYIIMMPLFFFFVVNLFAWRHVVKQARALGIYNTNQERYLAGLIKFVDAPVILPFIVMTLFVNAADWTFDDQTKNLVIGIIGCCLLVVSNLLTGVFDEHWSEVTANRRESNFDSV